MANCKGWRADHTVARLEKRWKMSLFVICAICFLAGVLAGFAAALLLGYFVDRAERWPADRRS